LGRCQDGFAGAEIADLETILVGNEREALALEHNLIKQYRPKFNVVLRDDKTYPYIKFTAAENIRACILRGASRKTDRCISVRTSRRVWRGGFSILSTSGSWFRPARWTSRDLTRGLACSTTSNGAWAPVLPG